MQNKVKHVAVLMMENRSFAHLFGFRRSGNGLKGNELNLLDPDRAEGRDNPRFTVGTGAPFAIRVGEGPWPFGQSDNDANFRIENGYDREKQWLRQKLQDRTKNRRQGRSSQQRRFGSMHAIVFGGTTARHQQDGR